MTPAKVAAIKALKVFCYAVVSAIVPLLVAYLQQDPRYVLLIPVVNAALAAFQKFWAEAYPESVVARF